MANLRTFPFIQKREKEGLLTLEGLHFDLVSGEMLRLEQETGRFTSLPES
jgi:carbonic anhydrase